LPPTPRKEAQDRSGSRLRQEGALESAQKESPMRRLATLFVFCMAPLHAAEVYKCTSPAGAITFQDHPCPQDAQQTQVHIVPAPPESAEAPVPDTPSAPAADAAPPAPPPQPVVRTSAAPDPPRMWLCTRPEDGKQYMSRSGTSEVRMVPAGVLGVPGKGLSDTGVSAPGVRRIPVDKSPQAAPASDYVAVQDLCEPAAADQVCTYLHDEYDRVHEKLRRAFKAEQAVLEPQLAQLRNDLDGC
jgi:hypothetical protein